MVLCECQGKVRPPAPYQEVGGRTRIDVGGMQRHRSGAHSSVRQCLVLDFPADLKCQRGLFK